MDFKSAARIAFELWNRTKDSIDLDVIHAQGLIAAFVGIFLKRRLHVKKMLVTILALYDFKDKPWWIGTLCAWVLNHYDKVFVEGETGEADLLAAGVDQHRIVLFQHWVNLDRFRPARKLHKGCVVLFVGRPIKIKGKHIIQAAEQRLFDLKGLKFVYIESVAFEKLPEIYRRADILVVPSLYSEGFSRVVAEGAASGCAVIASNRGSLYEMVSPFGMVIEPKPVWFAAMISAFYHQRKLLRRANIRSRLYAIRRFSRKNAEVMTKEYDI